MTSMMTLLLNVVSEVTVPEVLEEAGAVEEGGCLHQEDLKIGWEAGHLLQAEVTTEAVGEEDQRRWVEE